ncbi:MAG: M16 family metallopeptidase [Bacteroidales bacterium]
MKKIISYLLFSIFLVLTVQAQLDRSQRPQPGPAPVVQLGEFESFTTDNGIQVIVVENRKIPVISFQLSLDIDPVLEEDAKGYVSFAGSLMREGTTNRTKQEIDEAIDFIGANLSTGSSGMFASSLTRHKHTLLDLMSDILLNPTFPEAELDRRLSQSRTGLKNVPTDGNSILRNLSVTQVYGNDHPYGEVTTEENLDNITVDLLKEYYNTYFKPNVAYMVIVGDIDVTEAKQLIDQYFGNWEKGNVPSHNYAIPTPPAGRRVLFAERVGASQSNVAVTYPVVLTPGHEDAIKVSVMNSILGGGVFSGRLMQNLREDKGYTYGARSNISTDELVGRFVAQTEVRNSVTDSTVVEILYEMEQLIDEPVDEADLQLVKNFMNGSFARSLESPRTIANFALNIKRYDLPEDYYATYLEKLAAVSVQDVQQMAAKYLKPDNAIVIAVGSKEEVVPTLGKFSATGEVELFDAFGRPWVAAEMAEVPAGVTVETVVNKYYDAIGGKEHFSSINDMTQVMKTSVQGMEITMTSYQKAPDKLKVETALGGNVMSTQLFDGNKAVITSPMGKQEFTEGKEFEMMKMQAIMNIEMNYKDYGIEKSLVGIETVDGKDAYKIEVLTPQGQKTYEYYDLETGYKIRTDSEQGTAKISDYREIVIKEGEKPSFFARLFGKKATEPVVLKFPHLIEQQAGPQTLELEIVEIKIDSNLEDSKFEI